MTYKLLMTMALLAVPLAGCAKITGDTYCDIASPLYFDSEATPEWLLKHDRDLLVDIVVHNETNERLCK